MLHPLLYLGRDSTNQRAGGGACKFRVYNITTAGCNVVDIGRARKQAEGPQLGRMGSLDAKKTTRTADGVKQHPKWISFALNIHCSVINSYVMEHFFVEKMLKKIWCKLNGFFRNFFMSIKQKFLSKENINRSKIVKNQNSQQPTDKEPYLKNLHLHFFLGIQGSALKPGSFFSKCVELAKIRCTSNECLFYNKKEQAKIC